MDLYEWQGEGSSLGIDSVNDDDDTRDVFNFSTPSNSDFLESSSSDDDESYGSDAASDGAPCSAASDGSDARASVERRAASLHERLRLFASAHPHVRGLSRLRRRIVSAASGAPATLRALRHADAVLSALEREPRVVAVCAAMGRGGRGGPKGGESREGREGRGGGEGRGAGEGEGGGDRRGRVAVDVVSCDGLRWLRLRAARGRRLRAEAPRIAAALARVAEAAGAARLPQRRVPEVVAAFRRPPPRALAAAIEAAGARAVALEELRAGTLPAPQYATRFVCFDTTALIALCSSACFVDNHEEVARALDAFTYLAKQVRCERDDRCVAAHMEPAMRTHMAWMRGAEMAELKGASDTSFVATARPVDVAWIDALLGDETEAARESTVVREVAAARAADDAVWPNWVITDITLADFKRVVETVAGWEELRRARSLLRCCHVVTADYTRLEAKKGEELLTHVMRIHTKGKNAQHNRLVFGLCDALGGVMLSANKRIITAASVEDVEVLQICHPSRALIEQKLCGYRRREEACGISPSGIREISVHKST